MKKPIANPAKTTEVKKPNIKPEDIKALAKIVNPKRIKEDIGKVLNIFLQNESGNKITPFNMSGLAQMLTNAVDGKINFVDTNQPASQETKPGE